MSDELKLSKELIDNIMKVVMTADSRARDPFIGSQYLAAIVGYVVGTSSIPAQEKKEIMDKKGGQSFRGERGLLLKSDQCSL